MENRGNEPTLQWTHLKWLTSLMNWCWYLEGSFLIGQSGISNFVPLVVDSPMVAKLVLSSNVLVCAPDQRLPGRQAFWSPPSKVEGTAKLVLWLTSLEFTSQKTFKTKCPAQEGANERNWKKREKLKVSGYLIAPPFPQIQNIRVVIRFPKWYKYQNKASSFKLCVCVNTSAQTPEFQSCPFVTGNAYAATASEDFPFGLVASRHNESLETLN